MYVNPSDVKRESQRLGMADEFVRGQAAELQTRKRTLAQLRATWKRDFKAASKTKGSTGKGGHRSKMALLESVRKMLEQQERNMASEAKQLASVGEYLRLRQEKLNLVETSFSGAGDLFKRFGLGSADAEVFDFAHVALARLEPTWTLR